MAYEKHDIAAFLSQIPILKELSTIECKIMADLMEERHYDAKRIIFHEGDPGEELFIIKNGEVEIIKINELSGTENLLANLGAGDFFGEMSIIEKETRSATVRAVMPTDVLVLSKDKLNFMVNNYLPIVYKIYKGFIKLLAGRLRLLNEHYCFTKQTLENLKNLYM